MEGKGVGEDEEETNHLCSAEGGCVRTSPLWKTAQESLRRLTSLHCSEVKGGTPCGCFYPRVYPRVTMAGAQERTSFGVLFSLKKGCGSATPEMEAGG